MGRVEERGEAERRKKSWLVTCGAHMGPTLTRSVYRSQLTMTIEIGHNRTSGTLVLQFEMHAISSIAIKDTIQTRRKERELK